MTLTRELLAASLRSWYSNDLCRVGPRWLQLAWTLVFCLVVGCGFFVLGMSFFVIGNGRWPSAGVALQFLGANLVVALTIGFTVHALFALLVPAIGAERIRAFDNRRRGLFFGGVPLLGVVIGWPLGSRLIGFGQSSWYPFERPGAVAASLLLSVLVSVVFYVYFDAKSRQIEAEKRAAEAQLRLLQAQIEPHFLFNTLATVLSLIETEPVRARQTLEAFVDYLRASLSEMRRDTSTLDAELALSRAYLTLMRSRMGERLRYSIDVPDAALELPLAPFLLQPLVENAVRHGLEPKVEGGAVRIRAMIEPSQLKLEVRDDGVGLRAGGPARGNGLALHNIRERLAARYGTPAGLDITELETGTLATLRIPLRSRT